MNISLSILESEQRPRARHRIPPEDAAWTGPRRLVDSHGRTIRDLRLSITDRCNFRCVYCMDPGVRFLPQDQILTVHQIIRLARACISLGVQKIRLTGGEPTLHPELASIIRGVRALGPVDLAMTTNGSLVTEETARAWRQAGLDRLTISIDAVDEGAFARVTRSASGPARVIESARAAQRAGLGPVKLNAVIVRGQNEDQVVPLAGLARDLSVEMRFIEFMPLDSSRAWDPSRLVPGDEILARIERVWPLRSAGRASQDATATLHEYADGAPGRIGVIAPVTRPFCGACSRLRITADAKVRACLFSLVEHDLRPALGADLPDRTLEDILLRATWSKQAGHGITAPGFTQPARTMSAIGG